MISSRRIDREREKEREKEAERDVYYYYITFEPRFFAARTEVLLEDLNDQALCDPRRYLGTLPTKVAGRYLGRYSKYN